MTLDAPFLTAKDRDFILGGNKIILKGLVLVIG